MARKKENYQLVEVLEIDDIAADGRRSAGGTTSWYSSRWPFRATWWTYRYAANGGGSWRDTS
ncbi:MAG: hypothetical protein ACLUEV_06830 [Alistipes sp.]